MKKQVCVIGLGRFGATVAKELYQAGHDILALDIDEAKIQDMLGQAQGESSSNPGCFRCRGYPLTPYDKQRRTR